MIEHKFNEDRNSRNKKNSNLPDDLNYDWNDNMAQISGFMGKTVEIGGLKLLGDDYENDCRRMVEAGVRWLDSHVCKCPNVLRKKERDFEAAKDFIINTYGESFKEDLMDALAKGAKNGATGAMVSVTFAHAILVWHAGWENYRQQMQVKSTKDGMDYLNKKIANKMSEDGYEF